jgi:hypothetical protein
LVTCCHDAFLQSPDTATTIVGMSSFNQVHTPYAGLRRWASLFWLGVHIVSCGAPESPGIPTPAAADIPTGVAVEVLAQSPLEGGGVHICWSIGDDDALASPFRFALPEQWAGRSGFGDDLRSYDARDASGIPLQLERISDSELRIHHPGLHGLRLCYMLRPRHRLLVEASRFRAIRAADLLYVPGHALFAQPVSAGEVALNRIHVTVGDGLRSTIEGLDQDGTFSISQLVDSALVGGDPITVSSEHARVWIQPGVPVSPNALLQTVDRVVAALELATGPLPAPATAVVLRRADDPDALSGHGRLGGFVLEIGDRVASSEPGLIRLAAHEHLHRLIGHDLRFAAPDELETLWFREGVTEYVAVSAMVRAGVLPSSELFALISDSITNLRSNPADGVPLGSESVYWSDRDRRRLPYDRGALMAMLIELQTIASCGLTWSDLLNEFREQMHASGSPPLTNTMIAASLQRQCPGDWDAWFARYVRGNETLPVHARLLDVGLEVVERIEPAPWHGFRVNMTVDGHWYVSEVDPEGPAASAGVRAGQALVSEPELPTGRTERPAALRVDDNGIERTIIVPAVAGQRRAFVLVASRRASAHQHHRAFALPVSSP